MLNSSSVPSSPTRRLNSRVPSKNVPSASNTEKNMLPMQLGDVPDTYADVTALTEDVGYTPDTSVEEGVRRFVEWYRGYYDV